MDQNWLESFAECLNAWNIAVVFHLQVSRFETFVTFALWGIIKLGGPGGFAKANRHLVMILSDTYMFSSWIAMMVWGGQNPVLWLVDFLEGESVGVSVCRCVFKEPCKLMCCKPFMQKCRNWETYLLAMMNMSSPASCDKYR
jgi:hypothetical protein